MYCLSEEQTEIFKGISQIQLEEIGKLFNSSIENLQTSTPIGFEDPFGPIEGRPIELGIKSFCIKSHGLYELIPLITPLLIKLGLVLLVGLCLHLMYNLIPEGE